MAEGQVRAEGWSEDRGQGECSLCLFNTMHYFGLACILITDPAGCSVKARARQVGYP